MSPKTVKRASCLTASAVLIICGVAVLWFRSVGVPSEDMLFEKWRFRDVALALLLFFLAMAFFFASHGRQASLAFWATVVPVFLFLVLLEGVGRVGIVDWDSLLERKLAFANSPGWSLVPNADVAGQTYQDIASLMQIPNNPIDFEFKTDEYGFRNSQNSSAGIIILGDSVVLGALVPKTHTVDSIASLELKQPVMQAALLGLSIQEEQKMLLDSNLPLKDKLVIQFLFEGNDLSDSAEFRRSAHQQQDQTQVSKQSSFGRNLWSRLVRLSVPKDDLSCKIDDTDYLFLWTRKSFAGLENEFLAIAAEIEIFREHLTRAGAEYALVFVPTKYRVLHELCVFPEGSTISSPEENLSDLPDTVTSWANDAGIAFLDLTKPLQDAALSGNLPWFWGDTHWNVEGHRVAGTSLAEWLKNQ
ncbi:MAG: hypothetical protein AAGF54_10250 [Pseudomonadota bacterium]